MNQSNKTKTSELPLSDTKLFSSLFLTVSLIAFSVALIFSVVLAPLITLVNSDGTISYLPDILEIVLQLLHLIMFFTCYAATCFCLYRFPFKRSVPILAVFSVATVFKYSFNAVSEIIFAKILGFTVASGAAQRAFISITVQSGLELLQYATIILIAFFVFKKHKYNEALAKKSALKLNKPYNERASVFPFTKILSLKNPLQRVAFISALTASLFRIVPRIYYDISQLLFFKIPLTFEDHMWMLLYYSSDIIFGIFGYFIMIFIFNKFDTKDLTLQAKYSE